jgi:hypothetical protein
VVLSFGSGCVGSLLALVGFGIQRRFGGGQLLPLLLGGGRRVVAGAKVGVDDLAILPDVVGRALRDDLALGHDHDPVRDVAHDVHVVFHEQHRHALGAQVLHVTEQGLGQRRVHAGHGLVEHDDVGLHHQRSRHLQQLALPARQRAREVVALVVQLETGQQIKGAVLDATLLLAPQWRQQRPGERLALLLRGAQLHVLHDREARQRLGQLERADHADASNLVRGHARHPAAVKGPGAGVGTVEAGEEVEEGGLTGTVGTDQCGDGAALEFDVLDIDGLEPAEAARDPVDDEDGVRLGHARLGRDSVDPGVSGHRALSPCGRRGCLAAGRSSAT